MIAETWRPVAGHPGCSVSDQGRVRRDGAPIKPHGLGSGLYPGVRIGGRSRFVHTLVLEAFVGPRPEGMECRHLNGNRRDPRLANLKWGTHAENMRDQVAHGTHANAIKTHCKRGHEFTDESTRITTKGSRQCLACLDARRLEQVAA